MSPDLDAVLREAVEAELRCLADDEFVLAERYTEWQVRGPTLEADLAIANIAQDELGHARLWYDLLEGFGYDETELIWERNPETFRHATLVERPFETGDWADCVVRSYLYDTYEQLRLEALSDSAYAPIADRVEKVLAEESFHREHAQNWLERLAEDAEGRARIQRAVDRLLPHARTLYEPTEYEDDIVEHGIRSDSLETLREDWVAIVAPFLARIGIEVPDMDDAGVLSEARGRDGTHTPAWPDLYEEITTNYRFLERTEAVQLMPRPAEDGVDD